MITGSSLFIFNSYEICSVLYAAQLKFDFKLTSEATIQPVFTSKEDTPVAFDFSHQGHALVTLYVQFLLPCTQSLLQSS